MAEEKDTEDGGAIDDARSLVDNWSNKDMMFVRIALSSLLFGILMSREKQRMHRRYL